MSLEGTFGLGAQKGVWALRWWWGWFGRGEVAEGRVEGGGAGGSHGGGGRGERVVVEEVVLCVYMFW